MRYAISDIEKLYPNWYSRDSSLSYDEQKWIWENVPLPQDEEKNLYSKANEDNVSLSGNVSGTCKLKVNEELFLDKKDVILQLKQCTYKTPPKEIATLLEKLFDNWISKEGHWLYIAQNWPPRAIARVITQIVKQHERGDETVKTPPAYFTHLIHFRKRRKKKSQRKAKDKILEVNND